MANFLGLESTTGHLLLESGDGLLLETQDEIINITFFPITLDLLASLTPWDGMILGGLDDVRIIGQLGEINTINVNFPLFQPFLTNVPNTIDISFPLFRPELYGFTNLQVGSGIYQITLGKTHDKYYTSVATGATVNAKFPNPFIQTALVHDEDESIVHIASYRIRVRGSGIVKSTLYTMNSVRSQQLADLSVASAMNREPTLLANFDSNRIMLRIETQNIDETFDVTRLIMFLKSLWTQRPQ